MLSCDVRSLANGQLFLRHSHRRQTHSNVIDPDIICAVQGDGISAPNVLGIDIRNGNILNDDIGGTVYDAQALALDDTTGPIPND